MGGAISFNQIEKALRGSRERRTLADGHDPLALTLDPTLTLALVPTLTRHDLLALTLTLTLTLTPTLSLTRHDQLAEYGSLRQLPRAAVQRLLRLLVARCVLRED